MYDNNAVDCELVEAMLANRTLLVEILRILEV